MRCCTEQTLQFLTEDEAGATLTLECEECPQLRVRVSAHGGPADRWMLVLTHSLPPVEKGTPQHAATRLALCAGSA